MGKYGQDESFDFQSYIAIPWLLTRGAIQSYMREPVGAMFFEFPNDQVKEMWRGETTNPILIPFISRDIITHYKL